ncbi:MAG: hypothetical protein H8E66_34005 [Planctomycetes bacterium]|nr:hypothetical protein [Planctomycetota bacterium]
MTTGKSTGMRWKQGALLGTFLVLFSILAADLHAQLRGINRAIQAQQQNNPALFRIQGVTATGIGSDNQGQAIIKVYTTRPGVRGIAAKFNGVDVVTEVSGVIEAFPKGGNGGGKGKPGDGGGGEVDPTTRLARPVPIGVSVGSPSITAGTLGCRITITDFSQEQPTVEHFILSNNHVLADENFGIPVDTLILQPGPFDGGTSPEDSIGLLFDYVPLILDDSSHNVVDAAIAITTIGETGVATPPEGYGVPQVEPLEAFVGLKLQKYGRTTRHTRGAVDAINATVRVQYSTGIGLFVDQIIIKGSKGKFSDGGDSGSLIVSDPSKYPVGLLFAGNKRVTIANRIRSVLDAFSNVGSNVIAEIDDGQ